MSKSKVEELVGIIKKDHHFGAESSTGYIINDPKVDNGFIIEKSVVESGWKPFGERRETTKQKSGTFSVEYDENTQKATIQATDDVKAKLVDVLSEKTVKKINELTENSLPEKPESGYGDAPKGLHV